MKYIRYQATPEEVIENRALFVNDELGSLVQRHFKNPSPRTKLKIYNHIDEIRRELRVVKHFISKR